MAQKAVVLLSDDLDGGTADETVTFALDGVSYEIDLSAANAATLRQALALYTAAARRTGGRSTVRRTGGRSTVRRTGGAARTAPRRWRIPRFFRGSGTPSSAASRSAGLSPARQARATPHGTTLTEP